MTDYTNLLERLAVSAGDQECLYADAKEAIEALQARVAELESRLEVDPDHDIDGIAARDATIKLQDGRIAKLDAERNIWRDKYMTQAGQLDLLKDVAAVLAQERAEGETPEPVFWYRPRSDGLGYDGPLHHSQIEPVRKESGAWVALYAAQPVADPVYFLGRAIVSAVLRASGFKVEGEQ